LEKALDKRFEALHGKNEDLVKEVLVNDNDGKEHWCEE